MDRNRRSHTERLDQFVRDNRVTIALVFPLVGAALLVTSAEGLLWEPLAFNPLLVLVGAAIMRLPLIAGLLPVADRRLAGVLLGLTGYTYAIEYVGLTTGWPYGEFQYAVALGPMLGGVPLALPLFFLPLVLNATLLATLLTDGRATHWTIRLGGAVLTVLIIDLVLDPAAVSIGFWAYDGAGPYYGVPLSNYLGWLLSGTVAVVALEYGLRTDHLRARLRSCEFALDDLVSFVVLWGAINALYGNWIPVCLTGALVGALYKTGRFDVTTDGQRLPSIDR